MSIDPLIDLHARGPGDFRPLLDFRLDKNAEFGGRHRQRRNALLRPALLYLGGVEDLVDLGIQEIDDGLGRSGRRDDPDPT